MTDESRTGPFGAFQYTHEEWLAETGDVFYFRLKKDEEPYKHWSKIHFELAAKYCFKRCSGWFYHEDEHYAFGSMDDMVLFKLWVTNNRQIHQATEMVLEQIDS